MKKIFLLILCLGMMLSSVTSFAEEEALQDEEQVTDITQTGFAEDIELVINLGLTEGYNGIYDVYSNLTRAEFVVFASNLVDTDSFEPVKVFRDVDQSSAAFNAIAKLYSRGYIEGDGNGFFRPSDPIKVAEAARILLSIAGYNRMGDNLDEYMKIANEQGLTKGISSSDGYLTNGYAVRMFVNALDLNIVEYKQSGGEVHLEISKDRTVLSDIADIHTIEGQLTATSELNIEGGETMPEGKILFGGYILRSYDYNDYIGYYGKCYYKENEWESGEFDVLYIKPDKDNKTVRVEAEDFQGYEDYKYSYLDENDRIKNLKLSSSTIFIYNGSIAVEMSDDLIDIDYGYINFLDSDGDNIYDIVQISEYKNMVVESYSNNVIYSKYDNMSNIDLEEYDEVSVFDESGKKVTESAITAGNVLSIYKNQESDTTKPKLKIVVSTKTVAGTVENVMVEEGETYVTIGEGVYRVYSEYRSVPEKEIELNDSGTYLLDANDIIVSVTSVINNQYKPAFLIRAMNLDDTNDPTSMQLAIKAYFSDTGYQTVNIDMKKVKIDGVDYKQGAVSSTDDEGNAVYQYQTVLDKLKTTESQIIMVKTKPDGTINAIDTTSSNHADNAYIVDDRLFSGSAMTGKRYKGETMVFEGTCAIDENTVVFVVPGNPKDAQPSEFMVTGSSYFSTDTAYDFTPLYLDRNKISADIILIEGSTSSVGVSSKIGVITSVATSFNEEEGEVVDTYEVEVFGAQEQWTTSSQSVSEEIYKITLGSNSSTDTIELITNPPQIKKGDIIKGSFDESGYLDTIVLIYDASEQEMVSPNPSFQDFHPAGYRYALGTVTRKTGNIVELDVNGTLECHTIGYKPITIIDIEEKNIAQIGSISDVHIGDTVFSINRGGNIVCSYVLR